MYSFQFCFWFFSYVYAIAIIKATTKRFLLSSVIFFPCFAIQAIDPINYENNFFNLVENTKKICGKYNVELISQIGFGGGGTVYKVRLNNMLENTAKNKLENTINIVDALDDLEIAKLSWVKSFKSIENECGILNYLNENNVDNIEQCLDSCDVINYNLMQKLIILKPYFSSKKGEEIVASVDSIKHVNIASIATEKLVQTVLDMISLGVTVFTYYFLIYLLY
jgi:hypothetical protein